MSVVHNAIKVQRKRVKINSANCAEFMTFNFRKQKEENDEKHTKFNDKCEKITFICENRANMCVFYVYIVFDRVCKKRPGGNSN